MKLGKMLFCLGTGALCVATAGLAVPVLTSAAGLSSLASEGIGINVTNKLVKRVAKYAGKKVARKVYDSYTK